MIDVAKEAKEIKIKELLCRHKVPKSAQQETYNALSELYDDLVRQYGQAFEFWHKNSISRLEEENFSLRYQVEGSKKLANHLFEQLIQHQMRAGSLIEKTP